MFETLIKEVENKMLTTINHLVDEFATIRTGRANPALVDKLTVEYYGTKTPLQQLATISVPDPKLLVIQPFDKNMITEIEQAIVDAQLGFNPSNNGEKVIINVPPLTEERRRDLVKQVKIEIEKSKISCRNVRQKSNDELKRIGKEGVSEDIIRDAEESVQNITNEFTTKIDSIFSSKESDIMQV